MDIGSHTIPHVYKTRSKQLFYLNSIKLKTVFGLKLKCYFVGTALCRKCNINISDFKVLNQKQLIYYIHYLDPNNIYI